MVKVLAGAVCQNAWRVGTGHRAWWGAGQGWSPPHSCHRHCSVSSGVDGRSGMLHTTSCGPGCPARPHSCTVEPGSHPPCPRPRPLNIRSPVGWQEYRKVSFLAGEDLSNLCPAHLVGIPSQPLTLECKEAEELPYTGPYLEGRLQGP